MTETAHTHRAQLKLGTIVLVTMVVVLVVLRLSGAFAIGYVPSDSMEPTLPSGSLFLSLPLEPDEGSIVVFTIPTGERIVHRVVDVQEDGLVTQGDNNKMTDQDQGWDPVDPDDVQVVPQPNGKPLAVVSPINSVVMIITLQIVLLGLALLGGLRKTRVPTRLRPHHLLVFAAVGLMIAAPMFDREYENDDEILVQASFLPIVVHVESQEDEGTWTVAPFAAQETGMNGPANVTIAPAFPGMKFLVPSGSTIAYIPLALALVAAAWGFRRIGA